jgi:hypothetical protein
MQFFRLVIVTVFIHLVLCGTSLATPLQNGDFSSGFTGWSGYIWDGSSGTYVDPASDDHFILTEGMSQISNDSTYYEVALFQEFDLPLDAFTLSFNFSWEKTDAWDVVQATLYNSTEMLDLFPSTTNFNQLTASGIATTDISSMAGRTMTIEFLLQDGDWAETDWFKMDNIVIAQQQPIPEPCTMALLGVGIIIGFAPRLRKYFSA